MTRTPTDLLNTTGDLLSQVRTHGPLVQCLTNTVTTNLVANAVLAVGASPAMVDIPGEAGVLAQAAGAVLINLGTPSGEQREAMVEAARAASASGTPWVLDPVGVGLLPIRTALAQQLLELRPTVVRGNSSEIRTLAGSGSGARGVDAVDEVEAARDAAVEIARSSGAVVAVSGEVDLITDGATVVRVANGTELFTTITGAGCALGAVTAAFVAVGENPLLATIAACTAYEIAGELAAARVEGPGSFVVALLDTLSVIDADTVTSHGRVS
ncbi:hydroxyethylthiazole kinase [Aeromicrobium sp. CF3.5]|uniref:hydroxyethylthiazole kinase n=1 Tax=Aeromicrobium sp. CF3.5 TaxID=3373078 RepID=UPI003EE53AE8